MIDYHKTNLNKNENEISHLSLHFKLIIDDECTCVGSPAYSAIFVNNQITQNPNNSHGFFYRLNITQFKRL